MKLNGIQWNSMEFNGIQWNSVRFNKMPIFKEILCNSIKVVKLKNKESEPSQELNQEVQVLQV